MNLRGLAVVVLLSAGMVGQQRPKKVDWTACNAGMKEMEVKVKQFNSEHPGGPQLGLMCSYGADPNRKKLRRMWVPLDLVELTALNGLRETTDSAIKAQNDFENFVIKRHGVKQPNPGDPCYYFVGIIRKDPYITIDPNSFFPECTGSSFGRLIGDEAPDDF